MRDFSGLTRREGRVMLFNHLAGDTYRMSDASNLIISLSLIELLVIKGLQSVGGQQARG